MKLRITTGAVLLKQQIKFAVYREVGNSMVLSETDMTLAEATEYIGSQDGHWEIMEYVSDGLTDSVPEMMFLLGCPNKY